MGWWWRQCLDPSSSRNYGICSGSIWLELRNIPESRTLVNETPGWNVKTKEGISTIAYKLEFLKSVTADLDNRSRKMQRARWRLKFLRKLKFIVTVGIVWHSYKSVPFFQKEKAEVLIGTGEEAGDSGFVCLNDWSTRFGHGTAWKLGLGQSILQISSTSEVGNSNLGLRVVGPSRIKELLNIKTELLNA